jgi:hypothetical protein
MKLLLVQFGLVFFVKHSFGYYRTLPIVSWTRYRIHTLHAKLNKNNREKNDPKSSSWIPWNVEISNNIEDEDENEYFDEDDYENENYPDEKKNSLLECMRKFYNAVFFYGVEVPSIEIKSSKHKSKINRRLEQARRNAGRSSPFFTDSELIAQFLGELKETESEEYNHEIDVTRSSNRKMSHFNDITTEESPLVLYNKTVEIVTYIEKLQKQMKIIEITLTALKETNDESLEIEEMMELNEERSQLIEEIQKAKIKLVTVALTETREEEAES